MKNEPAKLPVVLIFMGVAGSGKTTVGALFAKKTGAVFYEGDDFHPAENIAKMRGGIPLTDADREEWLEKLREIIVKALAAKEFTVLTCSALKSKYRDKLAADNSRVKFVHLIGPQPLIEERLKNRPGHFMAPALLESQLAILEPPADALIFSCEKSPQEIIDELLHRLGIIVPD
ncbi:MAG: gluconokinase [Verrucomicrobiota bacterium]|jgi:gluconokinase